MAQHPIIEINKLSKSFNGKVVLNNIDLTISPGESLVIIGGSGSGKSVLLKCILGLLQPDKGSDINILDTDMIHGEKSVVDSVRNKISMLFQGSALFDSLTVWENIYFSLLQAKAISRESAQNKSIEILKTVGLGQEASQLYPAELSGGMQRRVALARAIISKPEIIFFDEPTTGLDPIMGCVIDNLIKDTIRKLSATSVTITHDMDSAKRIADRIAMLHNGQIIWEGSKKELSTTKNEYVKQFIHGSTKGPIAV